MNEINAYLLSIPIIISLDPDDNIPTSAAIFVDNGAFDIARLVRNVSGCTLLRDVKVACNKHSDIAR